MSETTDPRAVRTGVAPATRADGDPVITVSPVPEPVLRPRVAVAGRGILGGVAGGTPGPAGPARDGGDGRSRPFEADEPPLETVLIDGEPYAVSLRRQDAVHAILRAPDIGTATVVADPGSGAAVAEAGPAPVDAPRSVAAEGAVAPAEVPTVTRVHFGEAARRPGDGALVREVVVEGWRIEVELESERRASLRERARRGHEASGRSGPVEVRAIIPGRIVALSVAPGDALTAGQQVLVLEAMKMQNELRAPREGSVERIAVAVGDNVEVGDLLLVIT